MTATKEQRKPNRLGRASLGAMLWAASLLPWQIGALNGSNGPVELGRKVAHSAYYSSDVIISPAIDIAKDYGENLLNPFGILGRTGAYAGFGVILYQAGAAARSRGSRFLDRLLYEGEKKK